ncbi:ComEA family DNA-binding protein [Dactylosporangium sp. NPDC051484]|uniref:ComEA family DNA-binding protein n=1 Tax=Dactylosporangium sp. NPDC051484 TaxID=3154942 RepID=UPI0034502232
MWRSDDYDDGSTASTRLARVTALPPDEPDVSEISDATPEGAAAGSRETSPSAAAGSWEWPEDAETAYPWDRTFRGRRRPAKEQRRGDELEAGGQGGRAGFEEAFEPGRRPAFEEVLEPRRRSAFAAFDPGRRGVRVLLVVAGLVVCISAGLVWWSRPRVTPVPQVSSAPPVAATSSAPAMLVVSVAGRVHRPGLVRLPAGSRVADAIEAAGGVVPGVDLTGVNLARKLVDGEMIAIGVTPPPGAVGGVNTGGAGGAGRTGPVNLNTATVAELQTLPGIGEVLAQRIVEFRDRHGGFRAVTDLRQVEGIGNAKFQQLKDRVTV